MYKKGLHIIMITIKKSNAGKEETTWVLSQQYWHLEYLHWICIPLSGIIIITKSGREYGTDEDCRRRKELG